MACAVMSVLLAMQREALVVDLISKQWLWQLRLPHFIFWSTVCNAKLLVPSTMLGSHEAQQTMLLD